MEYLDFLRGNPVVAFMVLLVLLITVVPAGAALYRKYRPGKAPDKDGSAGRGVKEPKPVRFLGTQMDFALLIFGMLLLLAIIARLFR